MPNSTHWHNLMIKGPFGNCLVYSFQLLLLVLQIWGKYIVKMRKSREGCKEMYKEKRQDKN